MKKLLVMTFVVLQFSTVAVFPQRSITRVGFGKLSDYVNDYPKRRNGQQLLVSDVPVVEKVTYEKPYKMYVFKPDPNGDVGNMFFTSAAIAKSLRQNVNSRAVLMTVTCVLVEFAGEQDVYRSPFATKIEGINMDGEIVWTVTGPPPSKLKMQQ